VSILTSQLNNDKGDVPRTAYMMQPTPIHTRILQIVTERALADDRLLTLKKEKKGGLVGFAKKLK
jgi:hypothetical protein